MLERAAVMPEWVPGPGYLSYGTIYSGLQEGWAIDTASSNLTVQDTPYAGPNNTNATALCFGLPTAQVSASLRFGFDVEQACAWVSHFSLSPSLSLPFALRRQIVCVTNSATWVLRLTVCR